MATGAGGVTAAQRWSRVALAPRQAPSPEETNGHWRVSGTGTAVPPPAATGGSIGWDSANVMDKQDRRRHQPARGRQRCPLADRQPERRRRIETPGNAKIPATTYFPERLPSQYLRRWRA